MIKRKDGIWTTIQCKNLVSDDGKLCNLCFKVLNGKFALTQQCPYCLLKIDLRPWIKEESKVEGPLVKKQFPKVRKEDTVGYERKHSKFTSFSSDDVDQAKEA